MTKSNNNPMKNIGKLSTACILLFITQIIVDSLSCDSSSILCVICSRIINGICLKTEDFWTLLSAC